ncbi:MAG: hypothetical protein IKD01_03115 [Oscillospiraceae bacterium]|nr:hypothetical protein [Oscillospiraceae bacterium]
MARTKGYRSYRGRGGGQKVLVVLLLIVLLAAVGFLAAQRYIVYEDDGGMRLDLPWFEKEKADETPKETPGDPLPPGELEIIIEQPPAPEDTQRRMVEVDESVLRGAADATLDALREQNANGVAVRVKTSRGELLYNSSLAAAQEAGAVVGSSIARGALEDMIASDFYTVARIAALHESLFSFANMADAAVIQLQHPGYIWYDPDSTFYLAPEKPLARQYLADIARECAAMGFDELLFDEFTYPPVGRISNIDVSARTMTQAEALALLAKELRAAVEDYEVKLSVELDAETVLAGGNERRGQVVEELAELFDYIYVPCTAEQTESLASALGEKFVPIVTAAQEESDYLLVK